MRAAYLIALVGVLYVGTAICFLYEGQYWKAVIFTGYTIGQVGFYFDPNH